MKFLIILYFSTNSYTCKFQLFSPISNFLSKIFVVNVIAFFGSLNAVSKKDSSQTSV